MKRLVTVLVWIVALTLLAIGAFALIAVDSGDPRRPDQSEI